MASASKARRPQPKKKPGNGRKKANGNGNGNLAGIKQGAGAVTTSAFPKGGKRGSTTGRSDLGLRKCLNANFHEHLPLPRAVGPYTPLRLTQRISFNKAVGVFGTMTTKGQSQFQASTTTNNANDRSWSSCIGVAAASSASAVNATNNCVAYIMEQLQSKEMERSDLVPSAYTIQIMNPNAIQTTAGIAYIGRLHTQGEFYNSTESWTALANQFVALNAPRLCSAAKLGFRGVEVSAVPYNMSALAEFGRVLPVQADKVTGGVANNFTWDNRLVTATDSDTSQALATLNFDGFAPIVIYNPGGIVLELLITIEYRNRFNTTNPAQAGHKRYPLATDATWERVQKMMEREGHGVFDIAMTHAMSGSR